MALDRSQLCKDYQKDPYNKTHWMGKQLGG
jgi:hypothetical protein